VRQLARRDPAAAAAIQSAYGRILMGFLSQLLGDGGAAEDVMQQVLLEAWQRGESFDPARASVLTWLMTIARSRAIDLLRRRVPEPHDPAMATALLDRDSAVEDHAEAIAARWQLTYLLSTLAPDHAELLRMRFQLDMSQSEIAEQTGIPLGTVKTRMVRALEQLRGRMEEAR
jgi:RNA polymerase sigma-70 factor (ECF subfamily)